MRLVEDTARALAGRNGPASSVRPRTRDRPRRDLRPPFLSKGAGGIGAKWRPKGDADLALHRRLIDELRHLYHAHADRTPRRMLTDTAAMLGL